jgi:hypothetical protein
MRGDALLRGGQCPGATMRLLATLAGHMGRVVGAAFRPKGSRVVAASDESGSRTFLGYPTTVLRIISCQRRSAQFCPRWVGIVRALTAGAISLACSIS